MVVEKNARLKRKAMENDYGKRRKCRICNQEICKEGVENGAFEYVKSKLNENYFHSKCVREEMEKGKTNARKTVRSKT